MIIFSKHFVYMHVDELSIKKYQMIIAIQSKVINKNVQIVLHCVDTCLIQPAVVFK
jgi:hypothetical protein